MNIHAFLERLTATMFVAASASAGGPPGNDDCGTPFVIPLNRPVPYEGEIAGIENATTAPASA
jgi:hypothetical protein